MAGKDDYEILCVRNYISLCIDDLAALAINSTLAFDLTKHFGILPIQFLSALLLLYFLPMRDSVQKSHLTASHLHLIAH